MATAHIIVGLPCSGKSTYAARLQNEVNGVLFGLDVWLIALFGNYSLREVPHEEHVRRVLAIRGLISGVACELLSRGSDVIFDDGFFLRDHRMQLICKVAACGADVRIHHMNASLGTLQERLAERNAHLPSNNFFIDPDVLDRFVEIFQPPCEEEGASLVVVDQTTR